jgi:hypothetical protein
VKPGNTKYLFHSFSEFNRHLKCSHFLSCLSHFSFNMLLTCSISTFSLISTMIYNCTLPQECGPRVMCHIVCIQLASKRLGNLTANLTCVSSIISQKAYSGCTLYHSRDHHLSNPFPNLQPNHFSFSLDIDDRCRSTVVVRLSNTNIVIISRNLETPHHLNTS